MARVLVVEDELALRTVLADLLTAEGHRVLTAENGELGLAQARRQKPDLILLDVMMPMLDGFSVVVALRRAGFEMPVLLLTAKGLTSDRVTGLDAGADDYLVKPFTREELLARVRALLRRSARRTTPVPQRLSFGSIEVDLVRLEARKGRKKVELSAREFAILRLLTEHIGEPVSREQLLDLVWGVNTFPTTRTVDVHFAVLRAKLEINPSEPRYLMTVHGVGYRLAAGAVNKTATQALTRE